MTSRRSRLKAVTNLPVRRKVLTSQGSADEAISVDNLKLQRIHSSAQKSEIVFDSNTQKNHDILEKEVKEDDPVVILNYADDVQVGENCSDEVIDKKTDESEIVGTIENNVNFSGNLHSLKTDTKKCFKSNLLSVRERTEHEIVEENQTDESIEKEDCTISNNNHSTNSNNNYYKNNIILEDGNKSYTVLTTQNVRLPPLSNYTITPLTPCDNAYVSPNINEYPPQEYEEVHIYTDIERNALYMNEEPIQEVRRPSVIIKISSSGSENEVNNMQINYESLGPECIESRNEFLKTSLRSQTMNFKSSSGNDSDPKNSGLQTKYTHTLENSSSNGPTDIYSYRQCISSARRKRSKYNEYTKKLADAKREFQRKYEKTKPDRSTLKMIDLIFYNPTTNPMESKNKFERKDALVSSSDVIHNFLEEEKVDEPDALDCNLQTQTLDNDEVENINKMPVPQVKIGLDGEIILDEKSIIIETTDAKKGREGLQNSVPVFEDKGCKMSYYRGKSRKSRDWADFETKRFYKALNTIGPDFSLMQKYFPKRSRLELKNKFKREEKLNRSLIDKALNNPSEFDMTELEKDLAVEKEVEEEEIEMRLCRIVKRSARKPRVKSSLLSREMIESDVESDDDVSKPNDVNVKRLLESDRSKKKREFDFVLQKLLIKDSEKSFSEFQRDSPTSPNSFQDLKQRLIES